MKHSCNSYLFVFLVLSCNSGTEQKEQSSGKDSSYLQPADSLIHNPQKAYAPEKPSKFSHSLHGGVLKIDCKTCHLNSDDTDRHRRVQSIPCENCHIKHRSIEKDILK
jgi:hypothetical protein